LVLLSLLALVLTLSLRPVLAENQNKNKDDESFSPPEIEGTYDVPGHPNMKVRVFIYRIKERGRPSPSPTPITTPVCGLDDPNSSAPDGITGYHLPTSWKYNLNPGSVPSSVGSSNLQAIATSSFASWTNEIPGTMTITKRADTDANRAKFDRQNIIAWGRTSSSALAVTYTWYNTYTKEFVDVDTIMNNSVPWSWSGSETCAYPDSYDAQNILTHELGHWMGMDDMKTDEFVDNTMYGWGSTKEAKKDTLTKGDIAGLKTIPTY